MPSEFTPPWQWARMTKAQVKKYIEDLKKKRAIAKKKLEKALASWELEKEQQEVEKLEKFLDDL